MEDNNVRLRELIVSDKPKVAKLINNKKIWDNVRDYIPYPYDQDDAETFILGTKEKLPRQALAIVFNDELCGVISLIVQDDIYKRSAEIGYWIGEPYWGKGIATKAVALITHYGFKKLNLIRIYAGIFEYNTASMHVLEKNGYKKEAIFQKAVFKNNQIWDEHRYFILNENAVKKYNMS
ncbi:GNAT family N-acetyltransferase [Aquimarina algiphila]|uniref:GNAT family N-acetyltransferase n=1 Tax=Aquimarina algiphila TaxID=2047982 RepID=A0A554VLE5_9FLAO|nr:GNAT family protein [Aquimarina algiphila]TSE08938.1 GNAT family N-acetyltransferase [Aquimarina algiphila]